MILPTRRQSILSLNSLLDRSLLLLIKVFIIPCTRVFMATEARRYGGRLFLGDRDVRVTLLRAWVSLSFFEKIKVLYNLTRMVSP